MLWRRQMRSLTHADKEGGQSGKVYEQLTFEAETSKG